MATYKEIRALVRRKHGWVAQTCWIAHCKELKGLPLGRAHNRSDARQNPCPAGQAPPRFSKHSVTSKCSEQAHVRRAIRAVPDRVPGSGVRGAEGARLGREFYQSAPIEPESGIEFRAQAPYSLRGMGRERIALRRRQRRCEGFADTSGSNLDDSACGARGLRVDRERVRRLEIKVPFNAKAEAEPD